MTPEETAPDPLDLVDGNKNETEIPIGGVQDIEARESAMWRCGNCGEMGKLDAGLPDACTECAAPREDLYYRVED